MKQYSRPDTKDELLELLQDKSSALDYDNNTIICDGKSICTMQAICHLLPSAGDCLKDSRYISKPIITSKLEHLSNWFVGRDKNNVLVAPIDKTTLQILEWNCGLSSSNSNYLTQSATAMLLFALLGAIIFFALAIWSWKGLLQ